MNERDLKLRRLRSEACRVRQAYEEEKQRIREPLRKLKDDLYEATYDAVSVYQRELERWECELHEREARIERQVREKEAS